MTAHDTQRPTAPAGGGAPIRSRSRGAHSPSGPAAPPPGEAGPAGSPGGPLPFPGGTAVPSRPGGRSSLARPAVHPPKIYCFVNSGAGTEWVVTMAMAEDGTFLASHVSSSSCFAKRDIGCARGAFSELDRPHDAKHERYAEHYPDGYELVWLDDPSRDEEPLRTAYALNQRQREEHEAAAEPRGLLALVADGARAAIRKLVRKGKAGP